MIKTNAQGGDVAAFEVKAMFKSELMEAYGLSSRSWETWVRMLPDSDTLIHKTRAKLSIRAVQAFVDHFGAP